MSVALTPDHHELHDQLAPDLAHDRKGLFVTHYQ